MMLMNNEQLLDKILDKYLVIIFSIFSIRFLNIKIFNGIEKVDLILNIILSILLVLKLIEEKKIRKIYIVYLSGIILLISGFFNKFGIGGVITTINSMIFIIGFSQIKIKKKTINRCIFIIVISFSGYLMVDKNGFNTNTIGQVFYIMGIYIMVFLKIKNKFKAIPVGIILFIMYCEVLESESRGVLLAFVTFCIISFCINKRFLKNKYVLFIIASAGTIGSIIFTKIYVYMWLTNENIALSFSEKSFYSGRQRIWYELFELIKDNPLTGGGAKTQLISFKTFNAHNSILNIIAVYGIIIGGIYIYILIKNIMNKRNIISHSFIAKLAFGGIVGCLILAFFETNLLWQPIVVQQTFLFAIMKGREDGNNSIYTNI